MEHWRVNRAGLINFWYYDEAEFQFEDGRMLLRGANGSGKSVTMQSLIPLLFDGNKSPERIDPFGSRARRMESYLLSEGLEAEERTGYLYLEFAKPEAGRFLTIGMGMRARKNMPLHTWYFIVRDNSRIGKNLDFQLYRDIGEKIPLTERELRNKLGELNSVYALQKEYKAAVNEVLFGFQDLTDFDELIELLIQIRSPKLSKEFKPTTMYEIMQNSLITLSDDDLRPMSEAIEYMDEIKLKVEALEESKRALSRISAAYDRYNTHFLALKARNYIKEAMALEESESSLAKVIDDLEIYRENHRVKGEEKTNLEMELEGLKAEQDSLASHDIRRLMSEKLTGEQEKAVLEDQLKIKDSRNNRDQDMLRELDGRIRENRIDLELLQQEIGKHLKDMEEASIESAFDDEHGFFQDDYLKSEGGFSFAFLDSQMKKYTERLKKGEALLSEYERLNKEYQEIQNQVDSLKQAKDKSERALKERERLMYEIQAEFAENLQAWEKQNKHIKADNSLMEVATGRVFLYNNPYGFHDIKQPVAEAYSRRLAENEYERVHTVEKLEDAEAFLSQKREEKAELVKAKDAQPARDAKVIKNREGLSLAGIPYMPLYMAFEFDSDCSESLKNTIEEALLDLGILDALVIDPVHREKAIKAADMGAGDKYIFAKPGYFGHDISAYLKAGNDEGLVAREIIEDILRSIWLTPDDARLFITEEGHYGLGIVEGRTSGEYQSKFLGRLARKRYKDELIALLEEEISGAKTLCGQLRQKLQDNAAERKQTEEEWACFPAEDDLKTAFDEQKLAGEEDDRIRRNLALEMEKGEACYQAAKEKSLEIAEGLKRIHLTATSAAYREALDYMGDYSEALNNLRIADNKQGYKIEISASLENQHEDLAMRISEASEEIDRMGRQLRKLLTRLDDISEQLAVSSNVEIIQRMEYVEGRMLEIPKEISRLSELCGNLKAQAGNLEIRKAGEESNVKSRTVKAEIFARIFGAEYELFYVEKHDKETADEAAGYQGAPDSGRLATAKRILKDYGSALEEKKTAGKRAEELQEVFNYQSGVLLEYNMKRIDLFSRLLDWDSYDWEELDLSFEEVLGQTQRMDIRGKFMGKEVRFYQLSGIVDEQIEENRFLLDEQDRRLFEDILINSISRKIRAKIEHSKRWVDMINKLMQGMNTSSSISFSLGWTEKRAQGENQLGTKELVDILRTDQNLLTQTHKNKMMEHFRSKIQESKLRSADQTDQRSFLTIMKEILDYRQWFEFRLFYRKAGVDRKEMTNTAFYTFSGGEKAMAMYVPLFAAVYAKYQGGAPDSPKVVSLDEAFAGVDERNINDMFRLMVELELDFIANSQVLFGDYESVPGLSVYELIRPENLTYVTVIPYKWNGKSRELMAE